MQRYTEEQAPAVADLTRLFGTAAGFETHIRSLLELRLAQVARPSVDNSLRDFVSHAVRDMSNPELAITGIRGIVERAFALIWEAELPSDRKLPAAWLEEWERNGVSCPNDRGKLPRGSGAQCRVLREITGTGRTPRLSRHVTRTTFLLVDHLQSVGDFGQHRGGYPEAGVSTGFAAASVLVAISLVESLSADLQ